ncbi:Ff.00g062870.m01.CDS01 [Fusarium sp. VM40]|nr:Ff.00g062870.m01.CDS01 [Fusarium sp. VM40]
MDTSTLNPTRRDFPLSQWGVAVPCNSESFKTRSHKHKPIAKDWTYRLSPESAGRTGSSLKGAFKHLKNPGIISLGGGLPLSQYFPFESLTFAVPSLSSIGGSQINENHGNSNILAEKNDLLEGRSVYDISVALNYSQGSGSAQLLRWIVEHTEMVHDPPYADWQCTMTIGSTSALDMALRMLSQPGDCVLSDHYTFASAVETALPMGVKFIGIEMDSEGILPQILQATLENWIPDLERRREIYRVAQAHDMIILEDDPYYFLQMAPYDPSGISRPETIHSPADLLEVLIPSYLSIDVDGRVIRMDSFSKVVSPGSRIGWITAPQEITERYKSHADVSTQGPSGFSQLALFKLLDEHWHHSGYLEWLIHIRREYTNRRDFMVRACERHLPKDIVSWEPAHAGMYQWLRVDWQKYPGAGLKSLVDIEEDIWHNAIAEGTLVARGSWFNTMKEKPIQDIFFRTTFAAAPLDKVEEAIRRFGDAVRKTFQNK